MSIYQLGFAFGIAAGVIVSGTAFALLWSWLLTIATEMLGCAGTSYKVFFRTNKFIWTSAIVVLVVLENVIDHTKVRINFYGYGALGIIFALIDYRFLRNTLRRYYDNNWTAWRVFCVQLISVILLAILVNGAYEIYNGGKKFGPTVINFFIDPVGT